MVSQTTRELVEGANVRLEDAGSVRLRGFEGARHVYRLRAAATAAGAPREAPEAPEAAEAPEALA